MPPSNHCLPVMGTLDAEMAGSGVDNNSTIAIALLVKLTTDKAHDQLFPFRLLTLQCGWMVLGLKTALSAVGDIEKGDRAWGNNLS